MVSNKRANASEQVNQLGFAPMTYTFLYLDTQQTLQ